MNVYKVQYYMTIVYNSMVYNKEPGSDAERRETFSGWLQVLAENNGAAERLAADFLRSTDRIWEVNDNTKKITTVVFSAKSRTVSSVVAYLLMENVDSFLSGLTLPEITYYTD